jgi:hypothetical protein
MGEREMTLIPAPFSFFISPDLLWKTTVAGHWAQVVRSDLVWISVYNHRGQMSEVREAVKQAASAYQVGLEINCGGIGTSLE